MRRLVKGLPLRIADANERGLALERCAPSPVTTYVTIQLGSVQGGDCIAIAARVAWSDGRSRVGIEFLSLSAESRGKLNDWVKVNADTRANQTESTGESLRGQAVHGELDADALLGSAAERAVLLTKHILINGHVTLAPLFTFLRRVNNWVRNIVGDF